MLFSFSVRNRGWEANQTQVTSTQKFQQQTRRPRQKRFLPWLECLEERAVPAVFTVWHQADNLSTGSLRWAIGEANASPGADLIRFARSAYGQIELNSALGQIQITDDLFINGPGADRLSVSGGGETRVFAVLPPVFSTPTTNSELDTAPEVTIRGLTITRGKGTDAPGYLAVAGNGGGLYILGGSVHLDRVVMVNNRAENDFAGIGGAVANVSGHLTVTRSDFVDNTAEGRLNALAGAIGADVAIAPDGASLSERLPTIVIHSSSFVGNTARSVVGVIPDTGNFGTFGGAISSTGPLTVHRTDFIRNTAESGSGVPGVAVGGEAFAGAIFFTTFSFLGDADADLDIRHSTFIGNTSRGGDGMIEGIPGGTANAGAVGVYNLNAQLNTTIVGNIFYDNAAVAGAGGPGAAGGLARGGGVGGFGTADLSLMRNEFIENRAQGGHGGSDGPGGDGRGGGLFLGSFLAFGVFPAGPPTATLSRDMFFNNTAVGGNGVLGGDGLGGGIFNTGTVDFKQLLVVSNLAHGGDGATGGNGQGGGVFNGPSGEAKIARTILTFNRAGGGDGSDGLGQGGGIYNDAGGSLALDPWTVLLTFFNDASDDEDDIFGSYVLL